MSTARGQLRQLAYEALLGNTLADQNVFLPRDWPTNSATMPNIAIQTPREQKQNVTGRNGPPQFNAVLWLQLRCQVTGTDVGQVEDDLETLADEAERGMMGLLIGPPQKFQQIVQAEYEINFSAEGATHFGEAVLMFGFEYRQRFDIAPALPLAGMDITVAEGPSDGPAILLHTISAAPAGATVLTFAAPLPGTIVAGLYVLDRTLPDAIGAGVGVQSLDPIAGTVTLTEPAAGDIALGDTIAFVARVLAEIDIDLPS